MLERGWREPSAKSKTGLADVTTTSHVSCQLGSDDFLAR